MPPPSPASSQSGIFNGSAINGLILVEGSVLVLDGDVAASSALVLSANEIANLLVLGLLDGRLHLD